MNLRALRPAGLAVALCLGAVLPAGALEPAAIVRAPVVGEPAPAFDLPGIDGKRVSLAALRGKTVVVNAWATWCPPCRLETPGLIAAHKRLHNDAVFVGVDSTEGAPLVKAFVASKGIGWTQAIDADRAFSKAYAIRYFPTTWVIDPKGILRSVYVDVVTPGVLGTLVADANAGRNGHLVSALQTKVDGLLDPHQYPLAGDAAVILASVTKIRAAIARADKLADDSDPASGNPIDLPRTQAKENALREAAIGALGPVATADPQRVILALLKGDANWYAGNYAAALGAYRAAAGLDPKSAEALGGISQSARALKDYDETLRADAALAALDPNDATALVQLGIDSGTAGRFDAAREAFERAVALASVKAAPAKAKPADIRLLAWTHLYYGRMEAKAKDAVRARRQFALATQSALRLPKTDSRYAIYLEQAQEETVALDIAGGTRPRLSLTPWTGPDLPGSIPDTLKYRLVVAGRGGATVTLRAADLPKGWIASFCTDRICAPLRVTTALAQAGVKVIEFQVVPPTRKLPAHAPSVRVVVSDGTSTASARTN